jgi:hypothetical protein
MMMRYIVLVRQRRVELQTHTNGRDTGAQSGAVWSSRTDAAVAAAATDDNEYIYNGRSTKSLHYLRVECTHSAVEEVSS